jgi:hypothetical protein
MWETEHASLPLVDRAVMSLRGGVQTCNNYNPSRARHCCAIAIPWLAARRYHRFASAWSSVVDPSPFRVAHSEVALRISVALVGCQTVPPHRHGVVLVDPSAVHVAVSEVALRTGVALVGSQTVHNRTASAWSLSTPAPTRSAVPTCQPS